MWMFYVLIYGILKGTREIVKKKSMEKSTVMEVLFFYTLFAFVMVLPDAKNAGNVPDGFMKWIALKSLFVFSAWILSFHAIKKLPLSLYGVLDLSRVLFATLLAVIVLHETLRVSQIMGLVLVSAGLLLLKNPFAKKETVQEDEIKLFSKEKTSAVLVIFALLSCLLNALSGLMDKILMKDLNASQLQFWYTLFMVLYYLIYILIMRHRLRIRKALKNPWIYLLALLFVVGDRALFVANNDPSSRISVMTLIKQSGAIVTILAGRFIFKEKNTTHKLICAAIIILGILISVL
ncbi:MAG: DMT family transporter [Acetatifactor sp.]|nr:DMT family transporter [Acetatifactor sp.]